MGTEFSEEPLFLACLEVTVCTRASHPAPWVPYWVCLAQFGMIRKRGSSLRKLTGKFSHSLSWQSLGICSGSDMEVCSQDKKINKKTVPVLKGSTLWNPNFRCWGVCLYLPYLLWHMHLYKYTHTFWHKNSFGTGAKDCQLSYAHTHSPETRKRYLLSELLTLASAGFYFTLQITVAF